ncbi:MULTISPECIES: 2-oxo acid dehydrogenase subunit E2 [Spiroplasma]|uniref:2-oxo acid dehydrogenase subunit E2 n=1 Tax=Spiroplasma TaxID=2132 RepID=UPI001F4D1DAD|nr:MULTISPECIES: 2-oxo acid dehydrogenase subunit E2 [Spiroplasma]UNF61599.1 2-oxo acid dehydrogenase subunit E2 [Spiroplasma poulsonii]
MAKIIFEADDNRKGIIDKLFAKNQQKVQAGDKIVNVITQNKVYEIKTPEAGEVQNLIAYENKVINSGDVLLEIVPLEPALNDQKYETSQDYNTSSFLGSSRYNAANNPSIDIKKSETEIFREELIETLLAREVTGENPKNDFEPTIELNSEGTTPQQEKQNLFQDNVSTTSFLLKDKVENVIENIPNENNIETLKKDLGQLKDNLTTVKDDLETINIQEEIIEDIAHLERDLALSAEMKEKTQNYDEISNTLIHRMYTDIQEELNQESNEKELILDDDNPETIYFSEDLTLEELGEDIALSASNIDEMKTDSKLGHDVLRVTDVVSTKQHDNGPSESHPHHSESVVHHREPKPHAESHTMSTIHHKEVKHDEPVKTHHSVSDPKTHSSHSESAPDRTEVKGHSAHSETHPVLHSDTSEGLKTHVSHSKPVTHLSSHVDEDASSGSETVSHPKPHAHAGSHSTSTVHHKEVKHDEEVKTHHAASHSKVHSGHSESASHSVETKAHSAGHSKSHVETSEHMPDKAVLDHNGKILQADQIKLNHQAITRAKVIMESRKNIAHSFIDVEVDVSELVSLLSIMREAYLSNELELTLLPFYIKAVYEGLKKFPILNASFISKEHALLLKWFYNIAFSVDIDAGIKMPVLSNLKNESIKEIAVKATKLIEQTINDKLTDKDYQDASFSIVNYGEYGIMRGTFTIPEDNVAGIAMGIIFKKPVVVEKNDITIRDIMIITLGYNEAVIDITEASKFVHYVAYLLSNPGLLL